MCILNESPMNNATAKRVSHKRPALRLLIADRSTAPHSGQRLSFQRNSLLICCFMAAH